MAVIVIIAVLAAVSLPKFVSLKTKAIEKSEDTIMGALNTAIQTKFIENITNGQAQDAAWPCQVLNDHPFTLFAQVPPPYLPPDPDGWGTLVDPKSGVKIRCFTRAVSVS